MLALLLIPPLPSYSQDQLPEAQEVREERPPMVVAQANPITKPGIWPVKPNQTMKSLKGRGNCVKCMRAAGFFVPSGYVRGAGTIPVPVRDIEEGEVAVAVTHEGWVGHVVLVQKLKGKLIAIFECNHPRTAGSEVPRAVVKGFLPQSTDSIAKLGRSKEPLEGPVKQKLSGR